MPSSDANLADRRGSLVESHQGLDPRVLLFYFLLAALLLTLVGGLAWRQLFNESSYNKAARLQNQRRVLIPGPRGRILDRNGRILVDNHARFSAVLYLDEIRDDFLREFRAIKRNYAAIPSRDRPSEDQLKSIARATVAQRYLDQVNAILGRDDQVSRAKLNNHFVSEKILPYTLIDDLSPQDYSRLLERLPATSPLQVYTTSVRSYPFNSAAAHVLGYVKRDDDITAEDFPGEDLHTFKMKGSLGASGLERQFDDLLQGEPGGMIFRVDPAGYKINPPLEKRLPQQGHDLVTSLDVELQQAMEEAIGDQTGSAVALDVATGEVLAMASKPDYDLNLWSPRISPENYVKITDSGALYDLALRGTYAPGSTFKILVSIAGLRSGRIDPNDTSVDCEGTIYLGRTRKTCDNGLAHHGNLDLAGAIADSCDIYFYRHGIDLGPSLIAAEARRFHLDQPTGIELPGEIKNTGRKVGIIVPDPEWKKRIFDQPWTDGDTANMAIGQGFVQFSPLQMACFAASVARDETYTKPTLLHDSNRAPQHTEPSGLTSTQRAVLLRGMEGVIEHGTAAKFFAIPDNQIPGVTIAGKTGTAQREVYKDGKFIGHTNTAWFICFAPADHPTIAIAAALEGDTVGENYAGGIYGAGVAQAVLKKYFEIKSRPAGATIQVKPVQ